MDWTTIITASITALVAIAMPVVLAWSKIKFIATTAAENLKETTEQTGKLDKQAEKLDETHELVNGHSERMKEMYEMNLKQADLLAEQAKILAATQARLEVIEAFARGKKEGESS